ncbi:MAG: cadmium-translocating P-type ATPase [Clostridia bacterium]|nr:cadmium-translocating P-type ATPase [Clostridia bacterium]
MSRKHRKILWRIIAAAAVFAAVVCMPLKGWLRFAAFLIPYGIIGWDVLFKAGKNILRGRVFDENFLMGIATVGALAIGEYPEAVAVMLFYQVGELFQKLAVGKSRRSIAELMDIRPDTAFVLRDGSEIELPPEEVAVGEMIVVRPGQRIPLDGIVIGGESAVDTSALTGESAPRDVFEGEAALSGSVVLNGFLHIRVTGRYEDSTVTRILELVENAAVKKAKTEKFITRFARWYTPTVVICAAVIALLPPLFLGDWSGWIKRGLIFLVVSCPCALVISVPMSFFGGIGGASRRGILFKGANSLEALAKVDTVVFDKTGTLTSGKLKVSEIRPKGVSEEALISLAAAVESYSTHPAAKAIVEACGDEPKGQVSEVKELSGRGVSALWGSETVLAGNLRLMGENGIEVSEEAVEGTAVYIAKNGEYLGCIVLSDEVKPSSSAAVGELKALGVKNTVMFTGDSKASAQKTAEALGISCFKAELLPEGKVFAVEELLPEGKVVFVGDGINDAPVLARADIGVAMGALGSDAAIEAADVVLMDDDPKKLVTGIKIARKTNSIVFQNIVFALGVKGAVLGLSALGFGNMWIAVFADVGVAVIAILNAMRALKMPKS